MIRKPSVYADENEPTAVYEAALSGVCQWKNRELFRFCLVVPTFFLLCQFEATQRPLLFSTGVTSGVFSASTSGLSSRKQRITSFAKSFFSTTAGAILASTPHCRHESKSVKIRHFGLLANRNRRQALALCRFHLNATAADSTELLTEQQRSALNRSCPRCKCGTMHVIAPHCAVEPDTLNPSLDCATFDSSLRKESNAVVYPNPIPRSDGLSPTLRISSVQVTTTIQPLDRIYNYIANSVSHG